MRGQHAFSRILNTPFTAVATSSRPAVREPLRGCLVIPRPIARVQTRPLFYGMAFSWLLLATMACGKSPEEKAASKYLNPPKHH
eukprot:6197382-Pleurochrysis_carterae.AAC.2